VTAGKVRQLITGETPMTIRLKKTGSSWSFDIVAANQKVIASAGSYASRRNALETARKVAGKMKIVEAE
jgi:uncharacterized protein YegP (UPF0339 family)